MKAAAIAAAFDLGTPRQLTAHTYRSSPTWRLDTSRGSFLVKRVPDGWQPQLTAAMAFERRAAAAGIALPQPIEPSEPVFGCVADLDGQLIRVYRWLDSADDGRTDPRWLGDTLAKLHELQPLDKAPEPQWYGLATPAKWDDRLRFGQESKAIWAELLRVRMPDILAATDWIATAFAGGGGYVVTHRDVEPWNVLHTPTGPMLADWDTAGPDCASLEAAHAILDFAWHGHDEPDPAYVRAAREAYGRPLDGDAILARRLGMLIERLTERVDALAGEIDGGSIDRADAEQRIHDRLRDLPGIVERFRGWSALFRL